MEINVTKITQTVFIPAIITILGIAINYAVMLANGGMPVNNIGYATATKQAYILAGIDLPRHTSLHGGTFYPFLGDVLPGYFSIGDILIYAGLALGIIMFLINLKRSRTCTR